MAQDELVSVALLREDLRQLLVASRTLLMDIKAEGKTANRLQLAIERVSATATTGAWQPKPDEDQPSP